MIFDLIGDFLEELFDGRDTLRSGRARHDVEWVRWNVHAQPSQTLHLKASNPEKAFKKAYKILFTRDDRKYLDLVPSDVGAYVQIRNTNQSGFFVGHFKIKGN